MKLQRGFVVLPAPAAAATRSDDYAVARRRAPWRSGLGRARFFGAGIVIGSGIWAPVFAALADDPGPWGAISALSLFAVAGVLGRSPGGANTTT
jgi:hypothetical protein